MIDKIKDFENIQHFIANIPDEILISRNYGIDFSDFSDDILPFELYKKTRGNIVCIVDQINKSYCYGIYDGCFVLMRRLTEMLLILSFKEYKIESEIRDSVGKYFTLSTIIDKAVASSVLDLSRNSKDNLDLFRENGGLSAHSPFYTAYKKDIDKVQPKFRPIIQELFYKAGIKK